MQFWPSWCYFLILNPSDLSDRSLTSWEPWLYVTSPWLSQAMSPWRSLVIVTTHWDWLSRLYVWVVYNWKCERLVNRNGVLNQVARCNVGNDVRLRDDPSVVGLAPPCSCWRKDTITRLCAMHIYVVWSAMSLSFFPSCISSFLSLV